MSNQEPSGSQRGVTIPIPDLDRFGESGIVGVQEGIYYGIGVLMYVLGLAVISTILGFFSFILLTAVGSVDNAVLSFVIGLVAFAVSVASTAVFIAGIVGLLYKVIADGVDRGNATETR